MSQHSFCGNSKHTQEIWLQKKGFFTKFVAACAGSAEERSQNSEAALEAVLKTALHLCATHCTYALHQFMPHLIQQVELTDFFLNHQSKLPENVYG